MKQNRIKMNFYKLLIVFGLFYNHIGAIGALLNNINNINNINRESIKSDLSIKQIIALKLNDQNKNHSINHNHDNSVNKTSSSSNDKLKYPGSGCPTCENKSALNQNELIRLRIEFEKNQILKKLRLKERPRKIHGHHNHTFIPRSLMDGLNFNGEPDNSNLDEDYYAQTTQKVIFPNEDNQCNKLIGRIFYTNCYKFELTPKNDEDEITVNLAELWFYITMPGKHTYAIKQVNNDNLTKSLIGVYARRRTNSLNGGEWGKIDLKHAISKWNNGSYIINQFIEIECMTCDQIPDKYDYKPFIVIDIKPSRSHLHRKKRSLDCSSTNGIECCREPLNITFTEIGWSDWIIFPASYNAYYCKGSCSTAASVTLSGPHNQTIRKHIKNQKTKSTRNLELIPCCTASKYSSLELIYMDSNKSAIHKILPNMVVEECGCN